ncbi:hypothetical protein XcvCFBP7112P_09625 [Xanthomonas citri pv. vignicola]|nr:hypothetical protein XcvCFBP7112P_09625 [Xanthomonas citri pv. vignicola]MBZ3934207.1 hypothetical protein [Xanthomonas campestris pv. merremiae]
MGTTKTALKAVCALAGLLMAGQAFAQTGGCCAGGVGANATSGLGERNPKAAINLALDPAWSIYEFQRDGVTYLQINDTEGAVRAVVARVDNAMWVLPMGKDADRVALPSVNSIWARPTSAANSATLGPNAHMVYQTANFTVHVERQANAELWKVSPSQ